jgi:Tol biopolymer transport system component
MPWQSRSVFTRFLQCRSRRTLAVLLGVVGLVGPGRGLDHGQAQPAWDFQDLCWAPDGKSILFTGIIDSHYAVYQVEARAGSSPRQWLTAVAGNQFSPTVSPDGGRVAFHLSRDSRNSIMVANADGSDPHEIASPATTPAWSPDGRFIAYTGKFNGTSQIAVMAPDGSGSRQLTAHSAPSFNPSWSPDSKVILFESDRNGDTRDELYQIDADEQRERLLVEMPGANLVYPAFSEDGRRILFAAVANRNVDEYVMDADGQHVALFRPHTSHARESRAAGLLAFVAYDDQKRREIFLADSDGSHLTQVTFVNHARTGAPFSSRKE